MEVCRNAFHGLAVQDTVDLRQLQSTFSGPPLSLSRVLGHVTHPLSRHRIWMSGPLKREDEDSDLLHICIF